jgi:sugar/nucleoside kinase (ribokinase family)
MAERDMRIFCIGDLCCDLIIPYGKMKQMLAADDISKSSASGVQVSMRCGGSVGNTARALGRLSAHPVFLTPLKEDELGCWLKKQMEDAGVDMSLTVPSKRSNMYCAAVLDESGERTMFCFIPPWADYPRFKQDSFSHVPAGNPQTLLFTSGMAFHDDMENNKAVLRFFRRQKAQGSRIVFDLNVRAESYGYEGVRRRAMEEMISMSDIILGSGADEFSAVTGSRDLHRAAELLLEAMRAGSGNAQSECPEKTSPGTGQADAGKQNDSGTVIARNGGAPILILGEGADCPDGTIVPVRAVKVVSTLGAGDAFDAMFLKQLSQGTLIPQAVQAASDYAGELISRPDNAAPED